ncbi:MAG: hypothetical protein KBD37_06130 [Burkholderiales bacterium]|nr:hypothetical protein [Burkholderiales bacterium]
MNHTNPVKQTLKDKPDADSKSRSNLPKLTVTQIIEKFVTPSTHRKFVQLSEPKIKSDKK